jgi:hypothetical protein
MRRTLAATLAVAGALVLHGDAQPNQPIYLQYDGFVRNRDAGTITLSFGYYNMNHVAVKVQPGDANAFIPGPADRNQPITFLEGRHRFACAVVLPANFDGRLVWQVKFGGKVTSTTEKILNPLYELELNSERKVMSGLDLKTAPKGSCVNRSPSIQVVNPNGDLISGAEAPANARFSGRVGQELTLNGQVEDDGLPRDSRLAIVWRRVSGPGPVTFSSADTGQTRASFSAPGDYELELSGSDGEKSNNVRIAVTVAPPAPSGGGENQQ